MDYKEIYKQIIDCNLLNDVELPLLKEQTNNDERKIVELVFKHISIDLIFYGEAICPACVKRLIELESTKYEQDDINKMLNNNQYIDDEEYKLLPRYNCAKLATNLLFKRFCNYKMRQLPNAENITIRQFHEFTRELEKIKDKNEFTKKLNEIKNWIIDNNSIA